MEYIHFAHCVYHYEYHIVIVTKYRKEVFDNEIFTYVKKSCRNNRPHSLTCFDSANDVSRESNRDSKTEYSEGDKVKIPVPEQDWKTSASR